jgi:hypothetical protein
VTRGDTGLWDMPGWPETENPARSSTGQAPGLGIKLRLWSFNKIENKTLSSSPLGKLYWELISKINCFGIARSISSKPQCFSD